MTLWGKILYGFFAGLIGFLIIGSGTSSAGYVFLILVINLLSPVIQFFEDKNLYENVSKKLIPRIKEISEV